MVRQRHVGIIIGMRNTGKTYFLLNSIIKKNKEKVLIVDLGSNSIYNEYQTIKETHFRAWKSGIKRIIGEDAENALDAIKTDVSNALIVFEDTTAYVDTKAPDAIRKMIIHSKQRGQDLIFVFHSFQDTPQFFFRLANSITVFKTGDVFGNNKNRFAHFDTLKKVHEEVMHNSNRYYHKTVVIN